MAQSKQPLRLLAQPCAFYRERYISEMIRSRNRSHRYIRADANANGFDRPTIEIPQQCNDGRQLYIRVTLVTVRNEQAPVTCVHPYLIDTTDRNVIKDVNTNTIYFQISEEDFRIGYKNFRIIRKKLTQAELRNYGPLRLVNTNQHDIQRTDDPTDARQLIDTYQLGKSQLLFSMSQLGPDQTHMIFETTTVYSDVMTAKITTANDDSLTVRFAPQKGNWNGGDDVLMVVPKINKRKPYEVYLDYSPPKQKELIVTQFVDTKTIAFVTPSCLIPASDNSTAEIPIVVTQSREEIARVIYVYQSSDRCSRCDTDSMFNSLEESNTYEQSPTSDVNFDENDIFHNAAGVPSYMNR